MKKNLYAVFIFYFFHFLPFTGWSQAINRDSLLQLLPTLIDDSNKVNCLTNICFSYVGRNDDSILFYVNRLEEVAEKINHPKGLMNVENMNGMVMINRGDLRGAFTRYSKMLEIAEKNDFTRGKNIALLNISGVLLKLKEFEKVLDNYYKLIPALEKNNDRKNLLFAYMNMAIAFAETKKFDSSYVYNQRAYDIALHFKEFQAQIQILDNLGNDFALQGTLDSAKHYYRKALAVIEREKMYMYKDRVLLNLARIKQAETPKDTTAIEFHRVLSTMDTTKSDATLLFDTYLAMTNYFERAKKYDSAFYYLRMQNKYAKKIFNDTLSKNMNEMYVKYQTEIKLQKIDLLEKEAKFKDISIKKEAQQKYFAIIGLSGALISGMYLFYLYKKKNSLGKQLQQSLIDLKQTQGQLIQLEKEKEAEAIRLRISRDIHDDIGSNLTKIAMLGNLASAQARIRMPEMTEQLDKISDYARSVNSSMSEIIWAINPKQDTLENLLGYMRIHINEFLKDTGIHYKINFPENIVTVQLNPDLKRGLFLVLKESLNNIVKHAMAKNISIAFLIDGSKQQKNITDIYSFAFSIADDGIGFVSNNAEHNIGGNGLVNLEARMRQVGCSFQVQSEAGSGCTVIVKGSI